MSATQSIVDVSQSVPSLEQTRQVKVFNRLLAVTRIAVGWIFLWSFLDKAFGLRFATEPADAWIAGGSPAFGWLEFGVTGPLAPMFQAMAGSTVVDVLYMGGMLGMGLALILGIGLRVNAVLGTVMVVMMWAGSLLPETNPFMTYHLLYGLLFVLFAVGAAGHTWGLGRRWEQLPIVQRAPWLK
jgi:thiosulfate dehydrogenase (quinone) large subunit